ncbi:MAG: hypothetical protein MJ240_00550 [Kiritimatiellae bacterium]|nr:hypothetical protein [Kiritimatiellia bacterium]
MIDETVDPGASVISMSRQLEIGLLGDLVDPDGDTTALLSHIHRQKLTEEHFTDPGVRAAFRAMLATASTDPAVLMRSLVASGGEELAREALRHSSSTRPHAYSRVREIADMGFKRLVRERLMGVLAQALIQEARTMTQARDIARQMFGNRRGRKAYNVVCENQQAFNVVVMSTGRGAEKIIGSPEGCRTFRR